uniref:Family with sequence similarity 89 member B n=1 Tax=Eptatretus burgeri TaxID=7764 RepID=A0A8C4PYT9_EPTBU
MQYICNLFINKMNAHRGKVLRKTSVGSRDPPFCIPGLPPLPKSLSGLVSSSSGSVRQLQRLCATKNRIQDDLSQAIRPARAGGIVAATSSVGGMDVALSKGAAGIMGMGGSKSGSIDRSLVMLRQEMMGLRQLDMGLLCQLWSLHEALQEYKGMMCTGLGAQDSDEDFDRAAERISPSAANFQGFAQCALKLHRLLVVFNCYLALLMASIAVFYLSLLQH